MVLCMSFTSLTAFANSEDTEKSVPTVTEEKQEDTAPIIETPLALTPDGNLTLVDDVKNTDANGKQFITMQSKNGNYFYLVIDRDGDKENVYFLNLVDEADLMALIEEVPQETVKPTEPIEPEPTTPTVPEPTEPTPESGNSSVAMLALVGIIGLIGGGAFYYFKVMKPKKEKKGTTNLDDFEYDEDEEFIKDDDEYGFDFDDATDEEIEEEFNKTDE